MGPGGAAGRVRFRAGVAGGIRGACAVVLVLLLAGPVDLAILDGMGVSISESPALFALAQSIIGLLAYGCMAGVSLWITAYIRIRQADRTE